MPILLGTENGNATFKRWMETSVIPRLLQGKIQLNKTMASNMFIKSLQPIVYDRNISKNVSINYSVPINMMPRTDQERILFNQFLSQFNNLSVLDYSEIKGVSYPLRDLLYYYSLIAYYGKLGKTSLMSMFQSQQNEG